MKALIAIVCVLVALASAVDPRAPETGPDGVWTDGRYPNSGGTLSICQSISHSTQYTGLYSDVGYITGVYIKSSRTFRGTWYEAGLQHADGTPTNGTFEIKLTPSGTAFDVGSYWWYDGVEQIAENGNVWPATRLSGAPANRTSCWSDAGEISDDRITGVWNYPGGPVVIYESGNKSVDNTVNVSHLWGNNPGYIEAICDDFNQVCRGRILRPGYYGQVLFAHGTPGTLYVSMFEGDWGNINLTAQLQSTNQQYHFLQLGSRNSTVATPEQAAVNQVALIQGKFEQYGYVLYSRTAVGANQVVQGFFADYLVLRGTYDWSTRTWSGLMFGPGKSLSPASFHLYITSDWSTGVIAAGAGIARQGLILSRVDWAAASAADSIYNSADSGTSFDGTFSSSSLSEYICVDEANLTASYFQLPDSNRGYKDGFCDNDYQICHASSVFEGSNLLPVGQYEFLLSIVSNDVIRVDMWPNSANFPGSPDHIYFLLNRSSSSATLEQCGSNGGLVFVGDFIDPVYGGDFHVCLGDNNWLYGFYSEVGVVRGPYDPLTRTWNAHWFEAGTYYQESPSVPTLGVVAFHSSSTDTFSGEFTFADSLESVYSWGTVSRTESGSFTSPSQSDCWLLSSSPSSVIAGTYTGASRRTNTLSFCETEGTTFNASYTTPGYSEGYCDDLYTVCRGVYYESNNNWGVVLYSLLDDMTLVQTRFAGGWPINFQAQNSSTHSIFTMSRGSLVPPNAAECLTNSNLRDETDTSTTDTSTTDTSTNTTDYYSASGVLSAHTVLLGVIAVIACFF